MREPSWASRFLGHGRLGGMPSQSAIGEDYTAFIPTPQLVIAPVALGQALPRARHPGDDRKLTLLQRIFQRIGVHGQRLTNFRAVVGTADVVVLPYNASRAYAFIVNTGANTIFIAFDKGADTINGVPIPSGGFFEPILGTTSSVHAISTVANQSLVVCEGFYDWNAAGVQPVPLE